MTAFFHLISFGAISLSKSYALGLVIVWLVPSLAIVAWTRRIGGTAGAVLASFAFLFDVGSDREAGWVYGMFHGVWPQLFGVGLWLFALLALWDLCERATTRRMATSALLVGAALFVHPMNAVTLLLGVLLMFSIRLLFWDRTAGAGKQRGAIRLIPAVTIGGLIGLVWVVRMVMTGDLLHTYPAYWKPISVLMGRLFDGGIFDYEISFIPVLAVIGAIRTVLRGGRFAALTLLLFGGLLLVGSMDIVLNADLGLLGGKFGVMQYRRFSIPAKPLWYALSGVGFYTVLHGIYLIGKENKPLTSSIRGRILFSVFLAPFVWGLIQASPGFVKSPAGRPLTMERTGDRENVQAIGRLLAEEKKRCEDTHCLAVYWEKKGHGGLYPLVALADSGYGFLPTAKLPANNFRWINYTQSVDTMSRLGATVLITRWKKEHPLLENLGTYGLHTVYRILGESAGRVEVRGSGRATVSSWDDERRTIEISGASFDTRLILLMPPYRKWQARQNGKPLRLAEYREAGLVLSEVVGVQDGSLILEYHDSAVESIFWVVGAMLGMLCVVGIFVSPKKLPAIKSPERRARIYRLLTGALLALFGLLAIALAVSSKLAGEHEWRSGEPPEREILSLLHRSGQQRVTHDPDFYCVRPYTRDPAPGCTEHDLAPRVVAGHRRRGKIPSCLEVGIPPSGETRVYFPIPTGPERLKGRLHQFGRDGFDSELVIEGVPGRTLPLQSRARQAMPFFLGVPSDATGVTVVLRSKAAVRACIEMVALGKR